MDSLEFKLLSLNCKPNCTQQDIQEVLRQHRMEKKRQREKRPNNTKKPQTPGEDMSNEDTVTAFHSYAVSAASAEEAEHNVSPSTPDAKKGKKTLSLEEVHEDIIRTLNTCTDSLLSKIEKNANSIQDVDEKLNALFVDMEEMKETVRAVKQNTSEQETRIKTLEEKLNDLEAYQRRWNLRLYGVPEEKGENIKKKVSDICGSVAPEVANALQVHLDVCHRLGVREEKRHRPIIIRFSSRDVKEGIWRAAKDSDFLKARKLRFALDLTSKDKEARMALWPQVEAARKDGMRAFFVGAKAIIDGRIVTR